MHRPDLPDTEPEPGKPVELHLRKSKAQHLSRYHGTESAKEEHAANPAMVAFSFPTALLNTVI